MYDITLLEYLGIFAFAASGAFVEKKEKFVKTFFIETMLLSKKWSSLFQSFLSNSANLLVSKHLSQFIEDTKEFERQIPEWIHTN